MSYPTYPEKFNTYYNTGYKRFWEGSGIKMPYVPNAFVGGNSIITEMSDSDEMRIDPVKDLQNVVPMKGGCAMCGHKKVIGGRKKKKVDSSKKSSKKSSNKSSKKISVKDVMDYKVKNGVSLKEAWAHFKKA